MGCLSVCIFEWDLEDYHFLVQAKRGELASAGIPDSIDAAAKSAVTKNGTIARHCKRRTRGEEKTTHLKQPRFHQCCDKELACHVFGAIYLQMNLTGIIENILLYCN
jgi:hypothetical protein